MSRPRNLVPAFIERADGRAIVKVDGRQFTLGRKGDDPKLVMRRYSDLLRRLAEAPSVAKKAIYVYTVEDVRVNDILFYAEVLREREVWPKLLRGR